MSDNFEFLCIDSDNKLSDYCRYLYDGAIETEKLYCFELYSSVSNSARRFFECFIEILCEKQKITPERNEINQNLTVKYAATYRKITKMFPNLFAQSTRLAFDELLKICNEGSHYKYYSIGNIKTVRNDCIKILHYVHTACIWFYNTFVSKQKISEYILPNNVLINNDTDISLEIQNTLDNKDLLHKEEIKKIKSELLNEHNKRIEAEKDLERIRTQNYSNTFDFKKFKQKKEEEAITYLQNIEELEKKCNYYEVQCKRLENKISSLTVAHNNFVAKYKLENKNTEKTNTKDLQTIIYETIQIMKKCGAFCTRNTIYGYINGIDQPVTSYFRNEKSWGILRDKGISHYEIDDELKKLLYQNKIFVNKNNRFEPVNPVGQGQER